MEENSESKLKVSNATNNNIFSENFNEEIPYRVAKISEILKAKKNANFDIDFSSLSKKTFTSLFGDKKNQKKPKEEEIKRSNNNGDQKKYGNTDKKIPDNFRKRKYRLHTNDVKLPSNIDLLKKLCEKMTKNEKENKQPIFKFEDDENNNDKNKDTIKRKLSKEFEQKEIFTHKKTSSQNFCKPKPPNNENSEFDITNTKKSNDKKQKEEENVECKNLTYDDSKNEANPKIIKQSHHSSKLQNINYYNMNKFKPLNNDNVFLERQIIKNDYFIKLKTISIEFSFMENINIQFEKSMEDKSKSVINFNNNPNQLLLEIFDGHGGGNISSYLQKNFTKMYQNFLKETQNNIVNSLSMAFEQIDEDIKKQPEIENQGSTGTIIHIIREKNNRLFVYNGNVGDSRASLISSKKIIRLSQDHRTSDKEERKRIISEGGMIINNRVNGELMLTRSFGDFDFKKNKNNIKKNNDELSRFRKGVICKPFVSQIEIDQNINNQFLFLASDGIWDVVSEEDLQQLIRVNNDTEYLSSIIIEKALFKKAWDNLSIFVVKLT